MAWTFSNSTVIPTNRVSIIDRATTNNDATNTAAETTLYSYSLPGGTLPSNGVLRLTMWGDWIYNSASATATFRAKIGASTVLSITPTPTTNIGTGRKIWKITWDIIAEGATNAQLNVADWGGNDSFTTGVLDSQTGLWEFNGVTRSMLGWNAAGSSVDMTATQTIATSWQWGTATTNLSWRIRHATLELR